jgi:hypothetical protein
VRPDGVAIVEKARDLADGALLAPIDVSAAGAYDFWFSATWGGARTPGQPGTAASTCSSWTSRTPGTTFPVGSPPTTSLDFWFGNGLGPCEHAYRVYCMQE